MECPQTWNLTFHDIWPAYPVHSEEGKKAGQDYGILWLYEGTLFRSNGPHRMLVWPSKGKAEVPDMLEEILWKRNTQDVYTQNINRIILLYGALFPVGKMRGCKRQEKEAGVSHAQSLLMITGKFMLPIPVSLQSTGLGVMFPQGAHYRQGKHQRL